jgi:hypothetical protein
VADRRGEVAAALDRGDASHQRVWSTRSQGLSTPEGLKELMESNELIQRLRDPSVLREALLELGLDLETVQLVADLAPSRGITAFATETSVCVG